MNLFRLGLIGVFLWLAFLLNLERPEQLPIVEHVNLTTPVYVIGGLMIIIFLASTRIASLPIQTSFAALILIYAASIPLFNPSATFDLAFVTIALSEVTLLTITLMLIREVSLAIRKFDSAISKALLRPEDINIASDLIGERQINQEILRARRFDRPLTILFLEFPALERMTNLPSLRYNKRKMMEYNYLRNYFARMARNVLDKGDIMSWHNQSVVICLPETAKKDASKLVQQLQDLYSVVLETEVKIGVSQFPMDGLVYQDLIRSASHGNEAEAIHRPAIPAPGRKKIANLTTQARRNAAFTWR